MSADEKEPTIVKKKAIDVIPYLNGIYCTIAGGKPFVNGICNRRWMDDGKRISFMLETHNFYFALPDEEMDVVELPAPRYHPTLDELMAEHRKFCKLEPMSDAEFARTFAT